MSTSALRIGSDGAERIPLRALKAGSPGHAPRTYAAGRVCREVGCETLLSRYNRTELCWQHEPRHDYFGPVRGRRPAAIRPLDLEALGSWANPGPPLRRLHGEPARDLGV